MQTNEHFKITLPTNYLLTNHIYIYIHILGLMLVQQEKSKYFQMNKFTKISNLYPSRRCEKFKTSHKYMKKKMLNAKFEIIYVPIHFKIYV